MLGRVNFGYKPALKLSHLIRDVSRFSILSKLYRNTGTSYRKWRSVLRVKPLSKKPAEKGKKKVEFPTICF
jgi:hypothetical protein